MCSKQILSYALILVLAIAAHAQTLAEKQALTPVSNLIEGLSNPDALTRRVAADILAERALGGLTDSRAIEALIKALKDSDRSVRHSVVVALGMFADNRAVEPITRILQSDPFGEERGEAARALGKIGASSSAASLTTALGDADERVRALAAEALGRLKGVKPLQPLIAILQKDPSFMVRRSTAEALGEMGDSQAVPPLIEALRDKEARVRVSAAKALAKLKDLRAAAPLASALAAETDADVRKAMSEAINGPASSKQEEQPVNARLERMSTRKQGGNTEQPVAPKPAPATPSPQPASQGAAAPAKELSWLSKWLIGSSKTEPQQSIEERIHKLGDSDPKVRAQAAKALAYEIDPRIVDPLIKALADESADVRAAAAESLGPIKAAKALEPLLQVLTKDSDPSARAGAAKALGKIGDPRAAAPLMRALSDTDNIVRWSAATSLGQIKELSAVGPLALALSDPDKDVADHAAEALVNIGPPALDQLNAASNRRGFNAQAIQKVISQIDKQAQAAQPKPEAPAQKPLVAEKPVAPAVMSQSQIIQSLLSDLNSSKPSVRAEAAGKLGKIGGPEVVKRLIDALGDNDSSVRSEVVSALGECKDPSAIEPLTKLFQSDSSLRVKIIYAFNRIRDTRATAALIKALDDASSDVRYAAAKGLGSLKDTKAVEPLIAALQKDTFLMVRMSAAESLGMIGDPKAVEPLIQALRDSLPNGRISAARALAQLKDSRAIAPLTAAYTPETDRDARRAISLAIDALNAAKAAEQPTASKPAPAAPAPKATEQPTVQKQPSPPVKGGTSAETGFGDVVVVFEVTPRGEKNSQIAAQRIARDGKVAWGEASGDARKPIIVHSSEDSAVAPVAVSDGEGGAIVVFGLNVNSKSFIHAERIDHAGNRLWFDPKNDVKKMANSYAFSLTHPAVVNDGMGGAIIVCEEQVTKDVWNIVARRVSGSGKSLWGSALIDVSHLLKKEQNPIAISDGRGGALVFFEVVLGDGGRIAILGQHISADGHLLWGEDKYAIPIASTDNIERHPIAVSDGAGGAIVVFETEFTSGKYKGDIDISAQRVSFEGKLQWGSSQKPVIVANHVGLDRNPRAIPDGAGGFIIVWEHLVHQGENAGDTDIYAQRLNAAGKKMWLEGKDSVMAIGSTNLERAPVLVPDGKGGAIIVCEKEPRSGKNAGDIDIVAQRVSADGTKLWKEGKQSQFIASSSWGERWPLALPDGEGGAFVVYSAIGHNKNEGDIDIEIVRLDGAGKLIWNDGKKPVDVSATKDLERNPHAFMVTPK
jgi:HEAT repeat protein